MARKRAAALMIDLGISSGIVSIPIFFNIGVLPRFAISFDFMRNLYHAISQDHVVLLSIALLFTPVPLIYLRLCFRVFMHSRTPGETALGLVAEFRNHSGLVMKEIFLGFAQYCYVLLSFVLGTFAYGLAMTVLLGTIGFILLRFGSMAMVLSYLFWPVSIIHALVLCHFTSSRSTYSVNADHLLGLKVDFAPSRK